MTLGALVRSARTLLPDSASRIQAAGLDQAEVSGVTHDSRAVAAGAVFVAVRGFRADGTTFAQDAIRRGALVVVADGPAPVASPVPWLRTPDARLALSELSAAACGHPSESLTVVGVTGTNGKTTTTYLIASVFDAAGWPSGRMGTVTVRVGRLVRDERDAAHTTPEAPDVHRALREMVAHGCRACAMEVSSHALALRRVAHVRFAAGLFTNLTRDHLDFHGDMAQYLAAKRRLFELLPAGAPAVVNADDPKGLEIAAGRDRVVTYGIDRDAAVRAVNIQASLEGLAFTALTPRGPLAIRSPLVGRPNVYNILGTVATAVALDVAPGAIEAGIARLESVPGRFQVVSASPDNVRVVVDYAHTDDALRNLLETARPLAAGRLITVFGCGGDRDRTKRPLMGAVAARLSDLVVVTSDNPRSEDPLRIIDEITRGIVPASAPGASRRAEARLLTLPDRRAAISEAIKVARPGDLVLIAGKGHEKYQVIGDRTLPFDDVEVAAQALGARRNASRV
jgi:UDP-N-acetylmuramoyl-L-alanyl-D-glutamate--2,6-diaminopimelate ligase